eukprot:gene23502-29723_t
MLAPFLFFLRILRTHESASPAVTAPALAGLLLVIGYFSFGLTEVIFWSILSTMFYVQMLFLLMGKRPMTAMPMPRTLVISPNWIGDAVMAQPLLALLRAAHPERPIDVLAPPSVAPVWRQMAEVDEVLETPYANAGATRAS